MYQGLMAKKNKEPKSYSILYGSPRSTTTPSSGHTYDEEGQRSVDDEAHADRGRKDKSKDTSQVGRLENKQTVLPGCNFVGKLCKKTT